MKLKDILPKGNEVIAMASYMLSQQLDQLDCSEVDELTAEQLDLLFSRFPEEWDLMELAEVIQQDSLSNELGNQIIQKINERLGRSPLPSVHTKTQDTEPDPEKALDIFNLRDEVIGDYRQYIESFLKIRDPKLQQFVHRELERGELWPDPLVQLNPSYKTGATVTELIAQNILHPDCAKYFSKDGNPFRFHHHQLQSFLTAHREEPYILTTGTGSGKSLTYVVPIVNDLLNHPEIRGVRAILVYPMNALINSQEEEFNKFLEQVPGTHIRVEKYTGQEGLEKKVEIQNNPPQILLTNYVMLELMLSRNQEDRLVESQELKFLILDELHTYRGRQGADVAILIRKLRQRCGQNLLCIGTSATMSTEGSRDNRRQTVANVASKIFGVAIRATNVIDETLIPSIQRPSPTPDELKSALHNGIPPEAEWTLDSFHQHPLSAWVEMAFGLKEEDGHLVRRTPISLIAGAIQLSEQTAIEVSYCLETLRRLFLWGSRTKGLAFRLHQFVSQGGSVYATIEAKDKRFLTLEGQYSTTEDRLLYPLVFCRECGQDYYMVRHDRDRQTLLPLLPTSIESDNAASDIQEGYLTLDEPGLWNEAEEDRLPDNWFKELKKQGRVPKKEYADFIPRRLHVLPNGQITSSLLQGTPCWFIPKPFLTCLNCGIVHDKRKSEFTKLSRLSSEGRSTATTLLCLATVNRLKTSGAVKSKAQKILSFTDNRQDASLQAGHFNDFVQTSSLRASLSRAVKTNKTLTHAQLAKQVVEQMQISQSKYAKQEADYGPGKRRNEQAFLDLIEYRLYEDLRKGWRIVQPNLEQCGLLKITYEGLEDLCRVEEFWQKHSHPLLKKASPQQRQSVIQAFLDHLRKELAIDAMLLQPSRLDQLKREVSQAIKEPWAFDPFERLHQARWASISTQAQKQASREFVKLTSRSKIGRYLRSDRAWPWLNQSLSETDYDSLIKTLIKALADAGFLLEDGTDVQLRIDSILWQADQTISIPADPLTSKRLQGSEDALVEVNRFFQNFYTQGSDRIHSMEGREHTGQVQNKDRQERETKFREGELSTLFCSPTMELGIDISDLNVVHMRNVPPSSANYAQRSGRAGRSGQEALVLTYASMGSGHDQYFFKRPEQMVSGVVVPPKLELGNQDLITAHIHSVWLAHTGIYFENSMNQILDLDQEGLPLKDSVRSQLTLSSDVFQHCLQAAESILIDIFCQQDLQRSQWYSQDWIKQTLENSLKSFDQACDRWRKLYRDAVAQLEEARQIYDRSAKGLTTQEERNKAEAQEREARRQIDLLVGQINQGKNRTQLEFYPYRYFASEGFLPGYNFPRLPIRSYISAGEQGEYISRPRFVAIREFAPRNIVYYEGSKFQINKTKIPVGGIETGYVRVGLCPNCGYFHEGENWQRDICENCGAKIEPDRYNNPAKLNRVLCMDTMLTRRRERITCDEEERLKYGYNVTTHFRFASQKCESALVNFKEGSIALRLNYGETARILRVNRGLQRNAQERGFKLDTSTGEWGETNTAPSSPTLHSEVHLMVDDTCNILLIELVDFPREQSEAFLASFQFALELSIKAVYKLEDDELSSERLGQGQYILFWESSEGGAGVLSQIIDDPKSLQRIAHEALEICHFRHPKDSCIKACYECLLSYRNQFDHPLLDRHLVQAYLEKLTESFVQPHASEISREEQYQQLREQTDPDSDFERIVLDEIYQRGMKLPDSAQELIPEANSKPDFIYKRAKIAVFCDGSVHDHPDLQQRDRIERDDLEYNTGYTVFILRYDEDWFVKLNILASTLG
jgi:superfamily II DNA/RNA helicase/very-short-patch-repair endonuclease